MSISGKLQPIILLGAAGLGLLLGQYTSFGSVSAILIEVFLMALLYILFLTVNLNEVGKAFENRRYTLVAIMINFVVTPVIAWLLGKLFFPDSMEIRIGLLMLLVTPCTDWYLVFTGLAKGNVPLNISILPMNLILQIALMPVYLFVFLGSEISIEPLALLQSVLFVLCIPFGLAWLTKKLLGKQEGFWTWLEGQGDNLQLLFLCLAVVMMFASEGRSLFANPDLLWRLFIPLLLFFVLLLILGQLVGRLLKFPREDIVALNFTTLARNSPLSLAIAVVTFPQYPLVSLSLVIGPLIELPVLSIIANFLGKENHK